jgi:putative endonuclease
MKKYFVYLILTKDNTLYCGYTNNLQKRFEAHLAGKGAKYTRMHKPLKIIYSKEYPTKEEAMQEEYRIKQLSRKEKEEFLKNTCK